MTCAACDHLELLQQADKMLMVRRLEDAAIIMDVVARSCDGECKHTCKEEDEGWLKYVEENHG